ncbi:hypothetical protein [Paenibacillus lentus]|uniref:hypothetical protein n=1 Tax=Paenibacillus lentus TaxID=1338368 RepID=UPI0013DDEF37|nr:hypothetical protein [Paenibacillus lentus]
MAASSASRAAGREQREPSGGTRRREPSSGTRTAGCDLLTVGDGGGAYPLCAKCGQ